MKVWALRSHDELGVEMKAIQHQMIETMKNECTNALQELWRLCKEFGFAAGMLKSAFVKDEGEK